MQTPSTVNILPYLNSICPIRRLLILVLSILIFASCVQDDDGTPLPDLGYDYFPLVEGAYFEYRVDSIFHDQPSPDIAGVHDTTHYFVKEVYDTFITDGVGDPAMRIERYKRSHDTLPWIIYDVWTAKLTPRNAQRVEENRRYIKLGFPVSAGTEWDANALNILDTWTCSYDSLDVARDICGLYFNRSLRVNQRDFKNLVDDEYAYEIYAADVGLIRRYYRDLTTQVNYVNNPVASNIRLGFEYHMEIIDYGVE